MFSVLPGGLYLLEHNNLPPENYERIIPPSYAWRQICNEYRFEYAGFNSSSFRMSRLSFYNRSGDEDTAAKARFERMLHCGEIVKISDSVGSLFYINDEGKLICTSPSAFQFHSADNIIRAYNRAVSRHDYSHSGGKPRPTRLPHTGFHSPVKETQPALSSAGASTTPGVVSLKSLADKLALAGNQPAAPPGKIPGLSQLSQMACRCNALGGAPSALGMMRQPVEIMSGQKFLNGSDELDFVAGGALPLFWQRSYISSNKASGVLGRGWNLFQDSFLQRHITGAVWRAPDGEVIPVLFPDKGKRHFLSARQCWLHHTQDDRWQIELPDGRIYAYGSLEEKQPSLLSRITDRSGQWMQFHYDGRLMVRITDSTGSDIRCSYIRLDTGPLRLREVWQHFGPDDAVRRCRYHYNDDGYLTEVRHHDDTLVRQFGWTEAGLMAWHKDARGLRSDYRWEFDRKILLWQVVEQKSSTGAGYKLSYDMKNHTRTAHWHDGTETFWQLNDRFQVLSCTDRSGMNHTIDWDKQGLPCGWRRGNQPERTSEWDDLGNLLSMTDGNGHKTRWQYSSQGNQLLAVILADGSRTDYSYDRQGRLIQITDPMEQHTCYHYADEKSYLPAEITDAAGNRTKFTWNTQGQLLERTDCSGQITRWEYNQRGQLKAVTNPLDESICYRYNAQGLPERIDYPDCSKEYLIWDAAGQLLSLQQDDQPAREWHYNALGLVVRETDRLQRQTRFHYCPEGNLTALDTPGQGRYLFTRDAVGRLTQEQRPDGTSLHYCYDRTGVLKESWQQGPEGEVNRYHYRYDAGGNLLERTTG
ncbi:MAG: DUF6531 domain-containing protein, partial [Enterobacteriaceae bacterium]